nr:MAG TPA: CW7 repeat protein [Caudoviricetes sp.]
MRYRRRHRHRRYVLRRIKRNDNVLFYRRSRRGCKYHRQGRRRWRRGRRSNRDLYRACAARSNGLFQGLRRVEADDVVPQGRRMEKCVGKIQSRRYMEMTETELRRKVVSTALSWIGTREYDAKHYEMLDIYNSQRPLPRGTRMQATWPWCAMFVSVVSLQCGLRGIMPTECGCPGMVRLYQELGRWVENDANTPSPGDVIFYDWQDSGVGDNVGQPDHVGIVLDCDGNNMTIIEGNNANAVNKRVLAVNDRFIRGYGIPDYASKADGAEPQPEPAPEPTPEPTPQPTPQPEPEKPAEEPTVDPFITAKAREVINGKWGNGQARKDALAAWFIKAVQDEVNRLLS